MKKHNRGLSLLHTPFTATLVEQAQWQGARAIINAPEELLVAGQTAFPAPIRNLAVRKVPSGSAVDFIRRAQIFFFQEDRTHFSALVRDVEVDLIHALDEVKAKRLSTGIRMVGLSTNNSYSQNQLSIPRVSSKNDLEDLISVLSASFSFPEGEVTESFRNYGSNSDYLSIARVGYLNSVPVAAGIAVLNGNGFATLDWIGTVPAARGQGFARCIIERLKRDCSENDTKAILLTATEAGLGMYRSLGFQEFGQLHTYLMTVR